MKERDYTEGPEALENFERGMTAIFQVPKAKMLARKKRQQKKSATARKKKQPGNGKV